MNNSLLQHLYATDDSFVLSIHSNSGDKYYDPVSKLENQLRKRLTGKDKELFEKYVDAYMLFNANCMENTFISGEKNGAQLAHELFVEE